MDYEDYGVRKPGFWNGLPTPLRAAAMMALPFIIVDAFNYFSAGAAQVISLPVLALIYGCCGALAAKFHFQEGHRSGAVSTGALASAAMWGISTLANVLLSLIAGVASFGSTLLLGIPYLCLCAPLQLIAGAGIGALGAWIYTRFNVPSGDGYDDEYYRN